MSGTTLFNQPESTQTLPGSLHSRCRLTVTLRGTHGWQTFKGLFLSRCDVSRTFRATLGANLDSSARPDVRPGDAVGVTYRDGKRKCIFSAPFHSVAWSTKGGEVVLGWPETVHHLRRRSFERVSPPPGIVITVRLRLCAEYASTGAQPAVSRGRLLDISLGGLRLAVVDHRSFEPGTTYRCSFTPRPGRSVIAFDANVLHCGEGVDGHPIVGLQIVGLETQPNSALVYDRLARAVAYFRHAAARRKGEHRAATSAHAALRT